MVERNRSIRLPVTEDEIRMAHELAEAEGLTIMKLLRAALRRMYEERFGRKAPRRKSRT